MVKLRLAGEYGSSGLPGVFGRHGFSFCVFIKLVTVCLIISFFLIELDLVLLYLLDISIIDRKLHDTSLEPFFGVCSLIFDLILSRLTFP